MKNRPTGRFFQLYHFMKHIYNHFSAMSSEMLLFLFTECCRINRSAVSDNHMLLFDPWKVILEYFICSHDCHWHYLTFALCGNLESTFFERLYLCQVIFVFAACALRKYTYTDAGFDLNLWLQAQPLVPA